MKFAIFYVKNDQNAFGSRALPHLERDVEVRTQPLRNPAYVTDPVDYERARIEELIRGKERHAYT